MPDLIPIERIENKILLIRGKKVLLDSDLAILYGVSVGRLNEAVKRKIKRFPLNFMFQLNNKEFTDLKSQFAITKPSRGGRRTPPYVFTEQGVAMLSSVLRSKRAIQVNIQIMIVFTKVRKMLIDTLSLKLDIADIKKKLENQDKNIELVFSYLDELMEKHENPKPRTQIGYKIQKKRK